MELKAPLAGKVLAVKIGVGDYIEEDQEVLILETIKMQASIFAERGGLVKEVRVKEGDTVALDDVLAVVD